MGNQPSVASQLKDIAPIPVSVVKWRLVPWAVTTVLMLAILFTAGISSGWFTGTSTYEYCTGPKDERKCETKERSKGWNILFVSLGSLLGGLLVGSMVYGIGVSIYNPKAAAAGALFSAFR